MGIHADDALRSWVKNGMVCHERRNKITRCICEVCGKEVHGKAALMQHVNSKHEPKKYTIHEIDMVRNKELYG